jgi:hypothetical protein
MDIAGQSAALDLLGLDYLLDEILVRTFPGHTPTSPSGSVSVGTDTIDVKSDPRSIETADTRIGLLVVADHDGLAVVAT